MTIVDKLDVVGYTITGNYEGTETFSKKFKRIMEQNPANDEWDTSDDGE